MKKWKEREENEANSPNEQVVKIEGRDVNTCNSYTMCPTSSRLNDRGFRWQWIRLRNFLGRHEQPRCKSSPCAVSPPFSEIVVTMPTVTENHNHKLDWTTIFALIVLSLVYSNLDFLICSIVARLAAALKTVTKDHSGWASAQGRISSHWFSTDRSLEPTIIWKLYFCYLRSLISQAFMRMHSLHLSCSTIMSHTTPLDSER